MANRWIDFSELKRQVSIHDVLARYNFLDRLEEKRGGKLVGPCPIHGGKGKASFNVDLGKNIWNCFSACNGGGNVLDLVMKVEDCEIREAGEKLAEWFGLEFERSLETAASSRFRGRFQSWVSTCQVESERANLSSSSRVPCSREVGVSPPSR